MAADKSRSNLCVDDADAAIGRVSINAKMLLETSDTARSILMPVGNSSNSVPSMNTKTTMTTNQMYRACIGSRSPIRRNAPCQLDSQQPDDVSGAVHDSPTALKQHSPPLSQSLFQSKSPASSTAATDKASNVPAASVHQKPAKAKTASESGEPAAVSVQPVAIAKLSSGKLANNPFIARQSETFQQSHSPECKPQVNTKLSKPSPASKPALSADKNIHVPATSAASVVSPHLPTTATATAQNDDVPNVQPPETMSLSSHIETSSVTASAELETKNGPGKISAVTSDSTCDAVGNTNLKSTDTVAGDQTCVEVRPVAETPQESGSGASTPHGSRTLDNGTKITSLYPTETSGSSKSEFSTPVPDISHYSSSSSVQSSGSDVPALADPRRLYALSEKSSRQSSLESEGGHGSTAAEHALERIAPSDVRLRDAGVNRLRRRGSNIVSFTTEDFDLFQKTGSLLHSVAAAKSNVTSLVKNNSAVTRHSKGQIIRRHTSRRRSRSVGAPLYGDDSQNADASDVETRGRHRRSSEDSSASSGSGNIPTGAAEASSASSSSVGKLKPLILPTINVTSCGSGDGAHSRHRSAYSKRNLNPDSSAAGSKPVRTASCPRRKVSRRSTRRTQPHRLPTTHIDEFDDEDVVTDDVEEVEFSETDSEHGDGSAIEGSSDENDMEFEAQLVEKIISNRDSARSSTVECDSPPAVCMERRIANEILETERRYVQRLHLVDQIFHFRVVLANREHHMFPDEIVLRIFANVKSIYQFHHDFLLPQLERRMAQWDTDPCIGDVMRKFAPFLKLYSEYVKNFDGAMNTMSYWMEKSQRFLKIVEDIQKTPECQNLTLQHHMLEPIQRVPRYELLLKDYLKHLPEGSGDRENTQKALELVMTAAGHNNEAMRKIEKFRKLIDINDSLGGEFDMISPTRELVKEGKLMRISARDGDLMDRYVFLFNDLLLVCKSLPLNIGQRQQYHVKTVIDVNGMTVIEGDNLETPNTFYVKGKQKSLELHTSTLDEKMEWMEAVMAVIDEYNRRKQSRNTSLSRGDGSSLGRSAPIWIKDQDTSMCMICCTPFTMLRRRHHCRACGKVVCGKCSSKRAPLAYLDNRKERVCDKCCSEIVHRTAPLLENLAPLSPPPGEPTTKRKAPVILQVKGNDPSVISGYLSMSINARSWQRRWFAVHQDFVMYSFKAHQDVIALTSLPLPGYQVCAAEGTEGDPGERTFKVFHANQKKIYYFQTDDKLTRNRWMEVLQKVVQLELPTLQPPLSGCSTPLLMSASSSPLVRTSSASTEGRMSSDASAAANS